MIEMFQTMYIKPMYVIAFQWKTNYQLLIFYITYTAFKFNKYHINIFVDLGPCGVVWFQQEMV